MQAVTANNAQFQRQERLQPNSIIKVISKKAVTFMYDITVQRFIDLANCGCCADDPLELQLGLSILAEERRNNCSIVCIRQ